MIILYLSLVQVYHINFSISIYFIYKILDILGSLLSENHILINLYTYS